MASTLPERTWSARWTTNDTNHNQGNYNQGNHNPNNINHNQGNTRRAGWSGVMCDAPDQWISVFEEVNGRNTSSNMLDRPVVYRRN